MNIDMSELKALREAVGFSDGRPPWEAVAALLAYGVTPETNTIASRDGGHVQVVALLERYLVVVTATSAQEGWYRNVGEVPDDFELHAIAYPRPSVRSIQLANVDHRWMSFGSLTTLAGMWSIEIDGRIEPLSLPVDGDDGAATHLVRALLGA